MYINSTLKIILEESFSIWQMVTENLSLYLYFYYREILYGFKKRLPSIKLYYVNNSAEEI